MPERSKRRKTAAATKPALEFNHAMLYTRDLAASRRFYVDLLGFKVIEEMLPYYARLRAAKGTGTLAIHALEPGKTLPGAGGIRLYFETADLDKVAKHLEGAGIRFDQPPKMMPWGWKHAYLSDPDGHEISLYRAGAKRFQKTKAMR
jgi:catechol 2,3-dioxygenase-like lactoylglutathione lyase family enzyme